jgi:DNA-binding response OmpR family regulator
VAKAHILIVEDEAATAKLIKDVLTGEQHTVAWAKNLFQAEGLLGKQKPDLIVLDRQLPDGDGLDFCRKLRNEVATQTVPVLFLTSKKSMTDKVLGLEMGGDDYLAKPFGAEELAARVKALLRRTQNAVAPSTVLQHGPFDLNGDNRTAKVQGKEVKLTNKEFDLLQAFIERADRVLTRQFLLSHVWGYEMELQLSTKAVDMAIVGLRRKLGKQGALIETVKGHGYRLLPADGKLSR